MARKYGKNETTLSNVLKLVKALLALADEEIAVPGDKLKATFKVEWVKEDELLVSGKEKRKNRTQTVKEGITKEDLWTLIECLGEVLELSQPKDEAKVDNAQRKSNAIQDILECLKDLDILDPKPSAITKGFWIFSLKLKHQTKTEENLKLIKEQWKIKIGSVTVETSHQTLLSKEKPLNWQEICRDNLALQKQLTTNPFTNAYGVTPQLDEIYVPLAIVERKPPKPPSRNQQEEREEEKEEEKLISITEERFFEDVLRQGKSDISQGRKIAIIGEPGSGKTTRLQKIADWILEQDLGLPIWVSLADLTQPTISQYIEDIWLKQTGKTLTIDALTQQKERIWLLLDGLDEMTSRVEMRHVSALLGGWVQAARVVVTCRVNVWEADKNAFSGFDVFRNLEFNPEQVTDYIRRWFAGMGDAATGESLEAALAQSENSRLKELIQNPLRLWMLCQIWQTGGGLPETQAGLYGQFVDWVYCWKEDKEILDQREAIDKALARLALAAMEQKDEVSRLRLRESWVLKVLGSRPIFQAVMKLGWLNRVERLPEAICVFYHATFQEYFAALAVDDWDYFLPRNHVNFPVTGKEYRIFEPQWKQVILLWFGRPYEDIENKKKEEFIQALLEFNSGCGDWHNNLNTLLARDIAVVMRFKCPKVQEIESAVYGKYKFRNSYLYSIRKTCHNNFNKSLNKQYNLQEKQPDEKIMSLLELIKSHTKSGYYVEDEVFYAINNLWKIGLGHPVAIDTLLEIARISDDPDIVYWAIEKLGEIAFHKPHVIDYLESLIDDLEKRFLGYGYNNDDDDLYGIATRSLGKIDPGNPVAISALINIIWNCPYEVTISQSIILLGKIGSGNLTATTTLVQLTKGTLYGHGMFSQAAFESLLKILTNVPQMAKVVAALKDNLLDGENFRNYDAIIWHCANNMSYPEFYEAWHGLTEAQISPLTQLPQLLQTQLTETNLHQTLQLLCIDGSKFDKPDNPAADIYLQLVKKHHCPKSTEGTPRTLTELKIYWQLLDWEKHPILIFYEETNPQGFSQTFLDALTRFDATICLIADSPHPTIPTFSPHDPHLIQSIINWLQRTILET